ncbi:SigE family RNA polymerase sigma factor [Catellatospora tritici]|uniref:SigE family RNA polymerase sigma factor n=1 Tax=Catellatospora tritici TaxID=2851566 RepID=UPI001C2DE164|nr:SigE family RNA polymerase sigma factor [Catellatospora tritici]MBV1849894.1 SigE family RNA polymerase sigma factor [Catellatospora tritici]
MKESEEREFRDFAAARLESLRRVAYLLCHDWHAADDLVQTVLLKLYQRWRRLAHVDNLDAYVRGMLANAWLDELRRPWRRERATERLPEHAAAADGADPDRHLGRLLLRLGPRQRAVVVLRFYCDQSVEQTAHLLGISEGTVKSQAARALDTLRALMTGAAPDRTAGGASRPQRLLATEVTR